MSFNAVHYLQQQQEDDDNDEHDIKHLLVALVGGSDRQ